MVIYLFIGSGIFITQSGILSRLELSNGTFVEEEQEIAILTQEITQVQKYVLGFGSN